LPDGFYSVLLPFGSPVTSPQPSFYFHFCETIRIVDVFLAETATVSKPLQPPMPLCPPNASLARCFSSLKKVCEAVFRAFYHPTRRYHCHTQHVISRNAPLFTLFSRILFFVVSFPMGLIDENVRFFSRDPGTCRMLYSFLQNLLLISNRPLIWDGPFCLAGLTFPR